nr:efflux RND transporter periplasmic adaptor subunit [Salibaculum halophilum]
MSMSEEKEELSFRDDKGASRSTWIATILVVAIIGWMGSGYLLPSGDQSAPQSDDAPVEPVAVAIKQSSTEPVTLFFRAEGQAQPDRDTSLRAEASGDVAEVRLDEGDDVDDGDVIARLSAKRAEADLNRAREELDRAQREFDNASELLERGVATADRVSQARATLAAAEAAVTTAEEAIESLEITAPFAGRIESLTLDAGEFVQAGAEVGRIVDNRPLTVAIQVPQQALGRIESGQTATVTFITGEEREGRVSFVSTAANSETRTFLTKITVPNADGFIPAGISAEIRIPTGQVEAHFVQPSTISLSPEGRLGVKTVGKDDRVVFHPVEIVRAEIDGLWVTGMPETSRIITVGQGFVSEGEVVAPSPASDGPRTLARED